MEAWSESVPEGYTVSLDMLQVNNLVNNDDNILIYFNAY
jgi:hypothetical protein